MIDLLYLAFNRREFTEFTFRHLLENTAWEHVQRLLVFDDGSSDGTREYLDEAIRDAPVPATLTYLGYRSPVATMNYYLSEPGADLFVKVDNDLVVPRGWLQAMLGVMDDHPDLELLGMECSFMCPPLLDWDGRYRYTPWRHIGGNGLMKRSAFRWGPMDVAGFHGFTGYQWRHDPVRGFITPDLPVCLLDRTPIEPWLSLSQKYLANGWQRPWRKMEESYSYYWDWMQVPA